MNNYAASVLSIKAIGLEVYCDHYATVVEALNETEAVGKLYLDANRYVGSFGKFSDGKISIRLLNLSFE